MLAHMKKPNINIQHDLLCIEQQGVVYQIPRKVAEQYIVDCDTVSPRDIFSDINTQYTKPGALLKGIRVRENLTQTQMAKRLSIRQADISQMENGTRSIGRKIAQRIEKVFDVHYRLFLE